MKTKVLRSLILITACSALGSQALQQLKRDDTLCLFAFAGDVQRLENLTNNRQRIANRIGTIKAGGGTRIMDAVDEALRYMHQAAPDRRRAVLLISDNLDGCSFTTADRVIQTALETEAVVYSLKLTEQQFRHGMAGPIPGLPIPSIPVPSMSKDPVSAIAQATGGELFSVSSSFIESAFSTAISRLRLRYTLDLRLTNVQVLDATTPLKSGLREVWGKPEPTTPCFPGVGITSEFQLD